jgi:hypothetical protein
MLIHHHHATLEPQMGQQATGNPRIFDHNRIRGLEGCASAVTQIP